MISKEQMRLYAITDTTWLNGRDFIEVVEDVLKNGATFLQLREKNASHEEIVAKALAIKPIAAKYGVPFVINDDVLAAKEADVDGVHIGQSDMDYEMARSILGPDKIIGMTAKTVELAKKAEALGADYIGTGAIFGSTTKTDAKYMPKELLLDITSAINIPVVAIGGINYENMDYLKDTGVDGIAVVSAIFAGENPGINTENLYIKTGEIFNYKKNIIFDCDGTILDSMGYWKNTSVEYAESMNIDLPEDFHDITYSMDINEFIKYCQTELGIKDDRETILKKTLEIMMNHYKNDIPAKDGMLELIRRESKCNTRMCIFTSSDKECVTAALERFGIDKCIEKVITSYDIPYNKKQPESYITIANMQGYDISETWVYEDVLFGIRSAKTAGFKTCAVYDVNSSEYWKDISSYADNIRYTI